MIRFPLTTLTALALGIVWLPASLLAQDLFEDLDLADLPQVTVDAPDIDWDNLPQVTVDAPVDADQTPAPRPATATADPAAAGRPAESDEPLPPAQETVIVEAARLRFIPGATGSRAFTLDEIRALAGSTGDPNELLEIAPNVQFDNLRGRLNADSAGDLSPAKVSIAGGRFYENNFVVDGVSTNSQLDVVSQRSFDNTTGSTQSLFLDADLLAKFEVIDSNVSAEYGNFLGGVVNATTRDPRDRISFSVNGSTTSSRWTNFLIRPENITSPLPGKTRFDRHRYGFSLDLPLQDQFNLPKGQTLGALFGFTRAEAVVTRGALSSSYFPDARPRTTIRDNYLAKFVYSPTSDTTIHLQTILTPYTDEYWRTNISTQEGGGTSSKLSIERRFDGSTLNAGISFTTTENSRSEDPNHFIYLRTPSIVNVNFGGFGDLDVSQSELQFDIKQRFIRDRDRFTIGLQANTLSATRERPDTNFGYRLGQQTLGFPIIAADMSDGTIIPNEQFLTERNDYLAFKASAEVMQLGMFGDYSRDFELAEWLAITPNLGLRYDYDDFLENHNLSPRLSTNFRFPWGVNLTLGANRYHARNQLAYKLREQNPPNVVNRRRATFDGSAFVVGPWETFRVTSSSAFANGDLKTPYSDELSAALTFPIRELGEFRLKIVNRKNRDGLARSEPIPDTFIDNNGIARPFNRFELTNRGSSEYESFSIEYNKSWRNHTFTASTTFSETTITPGTDNYFSNTDLELENEIVYYRGQLINYSALDVQRSNFATPFYMAFGVTSRWLDDRLITGFRGRFRDAYESIESTDLTVDEFGNPGGGFELYEDFAFRKQFVIDASATYRIPLGSTRELELQLKIDNLLDSFPNVRVTNTQPFQEGRSYWVGAKYSF